jgi:hypothetical protein
MAKREDELPPNEMHKSPVDVAEYMHRQGRRVGRTYKTHGEVWDAKTEVVQTGLLHLILDKIESLDQPVKRPQDNGMHEHSFFLKYYHTELMRLVSVYNKHYDRLLSLLHTKKLVSDYYKPCLCMSRFSYLYRKDFQRFYREKRDLIEQVSLIRSIKTADEIGKLPGIGKKTAAKLRDAMESKAPSCPSP